MIISVFLDWPCVKYIENEWLTKEYFVFYYRYRHHIVNWVCNNTLSLRAVLDDDGIDGSMDCLSTNSALTIETLYAYGHLRWNWDIISRHPVSIIPNIRGIIIL